MSDPPRISEAEWDVMQVVWDSNPICAKEVAAKLGDLKNWSERTVKTLLGRLLKKGVLTHETEGKRYLYRPRLSREACVREAADSFLQRVFGGAASPLLAHLLRENQLSAADLAELRELLAEREAEQEAE